MSQMHVGNSKARGERHHPTPNVNAVIVSIILHRTMTNSYGLTNVTVTPHTYVTHTSVFCMADSSHSIAQFYTLILRYYNNNMILYYYTNFM